MTEGGTGNGTQGWGHYLGYSLSIPVVNNAIAGRSARSFTTEGHFANISAQVQANDIVIIEFGHNDGGTPSLNTTDNGRSDCPGEGDQTCTSFYNGSTVIVHTYNYYLLAAAQSYISKGAKVIISSQTSTNPFEFGNYSYIPNRFVQYAADVAGNTSTADVGFVDHGAYEADYFKRLGSEVVDGFFFLDHTHTSPDGADAASKAFVRGLVCSGPASGILGQYVVNRTVEIEGSCLG
ncbi:MAG: hypothetical protein M1820_004468 [Bogoriella megaspora]|nr:MAG: hypothetical protein M1820_004468 [Bogoriella megaspora]